MLLLKHDLNKIKIFAKANDATVNDVLMALFAKSYCNNTDTQKVMFPSTIDLRRFIPSGEKYGIGNYTSNCMCTIYVKPESTLANVTSQVSRQMKVYKSNKDILKSVMLWNFAAKIPWCILKRGFPRFVVQPPLSFTNFGIVDVKRFNFSGLKIEDIYLTASIKPRPYLQLTVSTYEGCCTLGCNIIGSKADELFVQRLFDDMCYEVGLLG